MNVRSALPTLSFLAAAPGWAAPFGLELESVDIIDAMKLARRDGVTSYFIEDESSSPTVEIPLSLRYLKSVSW